jgi:cytochrome c
MPASSMEIIGSGGRGLEPAGSLHRHGNWWPGTSEDDKLKRDEGGSLRRVLIAVTGVGIAAMAAGLGLQGVGAAADPATPAYYTEQVRPIMVRECGKCHLTVNHKGGLSFETRASTMKGGRDGAVIVPGDPAKSLLIKLIRHEGPADDPKPMPPKSPKISDAEVEVITQWIKAGAVMPNDPAQ